MTLRLFTLLAMLSLFELSCSNGKALQNMAGKAVSDTSIVAYFSLVGYSDTICALIYGKVYAIEKSLSSKDTLVPLQMVDITVVQNNKTVHTNSNGEFEIGLEKGVFSLIISKQGYEPIRLINYVSDPDQVSGTKIILVKGTVRRRFEIPKEIG